GALNLFAALPKPIRVLIVAWLAFIAAVGPVLLFFGTLISFGSSLVTLLGALGVSLPTIAAAFGSVSAVLTGSLIPAIGAMGAALLPILPEVL
ncbi:hypothetical protein, partial [Erwinia amylovora]|uniref:hypothetical protein n=1 Tax=Erwinia amylovora TaxID=552 RepID=UPI0020BD595D